MAGKISKSESKREHAFRRAQQRAGTDPNEKPELQPVEEFVEEPAEESAKKLKVASVFASVVLSSAVDDAISKAFRREESLVERFDDPDKSIVIRGKEEDLIKVKLSAADIDKITIGALPLVPKAIKNLSGYFTDRIEVIEDANELFEEKGLEKQIEMLKARVPKVLEGCCVFPEPEV
jgi:hypothetical protein